MRREIQAYIAYCAGRLAADWNGATIWDKDREAWIAIDEKDHGLKLQNYPARKGCSTDRSPDGVKHCVVDETKGHHICLSVYGKLFDGFDHDSTSHFSGMVHDDAVELYDFSQSDFYRFEKA